MVDTINCIIDAEKKAENIVAHANESAKAIILEGEREAEQIINTAIYSVKVSRLAKLKKATEKAEEKYTAYAASTENIHGCIPEALSSILRGKW